MSAIVSLYPNFPVFSMVLAAGLAYIPHFLRGFIVLRATKRWDNVNPRGQMERIQAKMTKEDWQMAKRAEGAHNNGIETLPVFYGAVLAALYTGVPKDTVNFYAGLFVATRALFNVVYIFNTNQGTALIRTGLWTAGIASCVKLFLAAANTKY
ncbi:hypothetical protein CPC16_009902 [Podila verticillata]|nr:hypothetical protein BGZ52_007456 [Haplosporangium bisporale]KAF9210937.1 hypothetical protein BGZ59_008740 [Podila verticillata]KAF9381321.1 hypothetical protein CPC16_009902 [Podila verticillata]KAI9231885.1 MAG: hypothetical protein BYD32DRAFT_429692 [Podila humilis]KFH63787.1 hypothetical protein MVEG_10480 [Podila verticillata NRRL 6337]